MKFQIIENIRSHNEWDSVKGIFVGIFKFLFFIVLIPLLIISGLIEIFRKDKEIVSIDDWKEFYSSEGFKLNRKFIDENEIPDFLDYPEESNDIYLFKVKSEPKINELEDKFIDYQFVTDENGIYLMSFNSKREGMTIWYIDNYKLKLEKVRDIESSWWNFGKRDGKIILETTLNRKDIKLEIKKTGYNNA